MPSRVVGYAIPITTTKGTEMKHLSETNRKAFMAASSAADRAHARETAGTVRDLAAEARAEISTLRASGFTALADAREAAHRAAGLVA